VSDVASGHDLFWNSGASRALFAGAINLGVKAVIPCSEGLTLFSALRFLPQSVGISIITGLLLTFKPRWARCEPLPEYSQIRFRDRQMPTDVKISLQTLLIEFMLSLQEVLCHFR